LRNPGQEVIFINLGGDAMELTGQKCQFYHFRYTATAPMRVNAMVSAMKEAGELGTKVYSINQNYSWGQDMQAAAAAAADAGGYKVVDEVLHDVNKIQDFAPFVARIKSAAPDTVFTGNWSNDLLLLMKAVGDAGLDVKRRQVTIRSSLRGIPPSPSARFSRRWEPAILAVATSM
ncbi:ABC transporter substrate-binding protein, partial [Agrobacterium sp. a22-2]|uniref:ABC transporter substrate-binding protein n=1 Tax=Agrobacterium sp. a22-2 TaxID=2283840 RepID=UPI0014483FFD